MADLVGLGKLADELVKEYPRWRIEHIIGARIDWFLYTESPGDDCQCIGCQERRHIGRKPATVACPIVGCEGDQCVMCGGAMRLNVGPETDAALKALLVSEERKRDELLGRLANANIFRQPHE